MEYKQIEIKLARATSLPILPNALLRLLELEHNPNASATDYERVISQDAAMAAKILRTANSSYFCTGHEITSLNRAVIQLGQATIRSICLAVSFQSALLTKKLDKRFQIASFWQHSLAVACASKIVAHIKGYPNTEEAFVAGLVHDIGKLALWMFLSSDAMRVYDLVEREHATHYDVEMKLLEVTHQEIGLLAAQAWHLPAALHPSIANHHTPLQYASDKLTLFVHVGNALADRAGYAFSPPGPSNEVNDEVAILLDISEEQYLAIQEAVTKAVAVISQQLGLCG